MLFVRCIYEVLETNTLLTSAGSTDTGRVTAAGWTSSVWKVYAGCRTSVRHLALMLVRCGKNRLLLTLLTSTTEVPRVLYSNVGHSSPLLRKGQVFAVPPNISHSKHHQGLEVRL